MSTLYEKRGRRYVPVSEHVALDHYPEGYHLLHVRPGVKALNFRVEPDHIALLAASKDALEAMCEAMRQTAAWKPAPGGVRVSKPLTRRQKAAWDAFVAAGGTTILRRASYQEVAEAGIRALVDVAKRQEEERRKRLRPHARAA